MFKPLPKLDVDLGLWRKKGDPKGMEAYFAYESWLGPCSQNALQSLTCVKISLIHTLLIQLSQLSGIRGPLGITRAEVHVCDKVGLNKWKGQAVIKVLGGSPLTPKGFLIRRAHPQLIERPLMACPSLTQLSHGFLHASSLGPLDQYLWHWLCFFFLLSFFYPNH